MNFANLILQAPGGWDFFKQNIEETLKEELHGGAQDLLSEELAHVVGRTPVLSGALMLDTSGQAYTSNNTDVLVELYPSNTNQIDEYNRFYADFVEGGPLGYEGHGDPRNQDVEMYFKVTTDDVPDIEAWGYAQLQRGLNRIGAGQGVHTP